MSTGRGYPRDPGLAARMLFVMFLLGLLYVAVMAGLFAAGINPAMVLIIAGGLLFAQYYFSSKIALFSMHAKEVTPAEAPRAPRHRRPALRPGRHAEAPGGHRRQRRPQRLRHRAEPARTPSSAPPPASCAGSSRPSSKRCWPTSCPTSPTATWR